MVRRKGGSEGASPTRRCESLLQARSELCLSREAAPGTKVSRLIIKRLGRERRTREAPREIDPPSSPVPLWDATNLSGAGS